MLGAAPRTDTMRASTRAALAVLALGIVGALAVGEGLVRVAARWSPTVRDLAVPAREREPRAFASLEAKEGPMPPGRYMSRPRDGRTKDWTPFTRP